MKLTYKISYTIVLLACVLGFAGCRKGDPGDPGAAGTAGLNGTNGNNGEAYNEATQYGGVMVYFSGKKPDGTNFTDSIHFKYAPSDLDYSYAYLAYEDYLDFQFTRFSGPYLGGDDLDNYIDMWYEVYIGEGGPDTYFEIDMQDNIATAEFEYFGVNNYSYLGEGSNVENIDVSEPDYDEPTGSLKFTASFTVPAAYNETGFDLDIEVVADVKVFQYLTYDEGGGRLNTHHLSKTSDDVRKLRVNLHH